MRKVIGWIVKLFGMAWTLLMAAFVLVMLSPALVSGMWLARRDMKKRARRGK